MNIVLDTNVIISGLLNPKGLPGKIINLLLAEKITLLFDNRIIEEYYNVLIRKKFGLSRNIVDPLIDYIKSEGDFVVAEPIHLKFEDEDDKKFLEVAISGNAEYLITGNKKHFPAADFIVTPREYFNSLN